MTTFSDPAVQALRTAYAQQIAVVRASARLLGIPPNLLDEVDYITAVSGGRFEPIHSAAST